jgi:hypothetical protein
VSLPLAAIGPSAYWYLTRGTGAVTLLLLSASVVLGIVDQSRWRTERWPRFALDELHQTVSLLVMVFLLIHIIVSVLDTFAPIKLLDAVVPFAGAYRPLWLGLGTLSFDLLLAVAITSLLRQRLGHRTWKLVHWLSYASWPVAVLHGLGTGSDVKSLWLLGLTIACMAAVWLALWVRVSGSAPRLRVAGFAPLVAAPLALILWLPQGPLAKGWARRAGTPTRLLSTRQVTASTSRSDHLSLPFSGSLSGTVRQSQNPSGLASIDLALTFHGGANGVADVLLEGQPLSGGGVSVSHSKVTVGTASTPSIYSGRVVTLNGQRVIADVSDGSGSHARLDFRLNVDPQGSTVTGSISGRSGAL